MSVADRATALGPYAQRLIENEEVQANLERALAASRDAYGRARGKKRKAEAVQDRQIQRRLLEAVQAAREVVQTLGAEREKQQRNRRGRVLAGAGVVAAGAAALALVPQVRQKVLSRFQGDPGGAPPAQGPVQ